VVHVVPASERSDEALLAEAVREGSDGPAFVELLARHRDRVWRLCYRLLGNEQDASDAAQEVFVRLFLNRAKFAGRSALATWLHGIAVRTCLTLRRGRSRRSRRETTVEASLDAHASREAAGSARLDLYQMLEALPEDDRAMLILKHAEGYSYAELAAMFDLSEAACKMRVSRAKERLKELFPEAMS
jgi:RNA polymerase sigma-70 factor (ECF subfamily)